MAGPQHRTPEYRKARRQLDADQAAGKTLWCVEPICLHPTREIPPNQPCHVCHDVSGTIITGPGHPLCNTSEGGRRGAYAVQGRTVPPPQRWVL